MKERFGLFSSFLILAGSFLIPATEAISTAGIRTIGLACAFLVLLITEALPLTISCWTILGIMPLIGVSPGFGAALSGFSNPVLFFILASFGISATFTSLPLSKRILIILLKKFGRSMKCTLFALMLCILSITSFVSSVPTAALFMAIVLSFLELFDNEDDRKATGKAFMIAIPITCLFGGIATPVGSTMNLLALELLEEYTGLTISFVQWMSIGIPIALLILPVAWLLIYHIYKPAEINFDLVQSFIKKLDIPPKLCVKEKKALAITSSMLVLWILSSWVNQINIMIVSLLGTCIMFFPRIGVLEWKSFIKNVNLDSFFLVGTVISISTAMGSNGVSDWISSLLPSGYMPLPMLIAFTITLVLALLVIMPVAPSVVMFLAVPLITLADSTGYSPALIMMTLAMASGNCFLLPLDTIPLITYSSGYYSIRDMPKSTIPLLGYIIVVMTLVLWFASSVIGVI